VLSSLGLSAMFLLAKIVSAATGNFSNEDWFGPDYGTTGLLMGYFFIFLFASLFYVVGFRAVTHLYSAEIAARNMRLEMLSIALAWGFAVDVAIAFAVGFGIFSLGAAFFLVWLFVNLVLVVIVLLLYPETQARNLEQLDGMLASGWKVLAGMDREARRGRKISPEIEEFDELLSDGIHGAAAELGNGPRAAVRREIDALSPPGK
jgi:Sugar (and other) transporter